MIRTLTIVVLAVLSVAVTLIAGCSGAGTSLVPPTDSPAIPNDSYADLTLHVEARAVNRDGSIVNTAATDFRDGQIIQLSIGWRDSGGGRLPADPENWGYEIVDPEADGGNPAVHFTGTSLWRAYGSHTGSTVIVGKARHTTGPGGSQVTYTTGLLLNIGGGDNSAPYWAEGGYDPIAQAYPSAVAGWHDLQLHDDGTYYGDTEWQYNFDIQKIVPGVVKPAGGLVFTYEVKNLDTGEIITNNTKTWRLPPGKYQVTFTIGAFRPHLTLVVYQGKG